MQLEVQREVRLEFIYALRWPSGAKYRKNRNNVTSILGVWSLLGVWTANTLILSPRESGPDPAQGPWLHGPERPICALPDLLDIYSPLRYPRVASILPLHSTSQRRDDGVVKAFTATVSYAFSFSLTHRLKFITLLSWRRQFSPTRLAPPLTV